MPIQPDPSLTNADLAPTAPEARNWSVGNMASLWIGMVVCVPTYMLAAGMIDLGMNWWQAVGTVLLGNLIVLLPMILNGHAGTKLGVPFPVLSRASFGISGAHIPSVLRGLVACGWFGIQTAIGGAAIYQLTGVLRAEPYAGADLPLLGLNLPELACVFVFWLLQVAILWRGIESIKLLETWAAPFLILMGLALLAWAYLKTDGWGDMLSARSAFDPGGEKEGRFLSVFFPSLTAMVGFWATLSLNIPDFTRFARSQRDQALGQALGLPLVMTLFAFVGVAVTSATVVIFGEAIPNPTDLAGRMGGGWTVVISLVALSIATLSTNIAANVVSPANVIMNLAPRRATFRMGALITAVVGVVILPWKLIESTDGYIFTWLIGYSALLGPIGGIVICDYFLVRRTDIDVDALYQRHGAFAYIGGVNPVAVFALVAGVAPNVPGFLAEAGLVASVPAVFASVYTYAWFVGFLLSGALYTVGMKLRS
ncbi:MAG: nitrate reductase [Planctomycetes bacterium]|jgi:NCS1 family nucleobase:cation symporter-1|nr:nitrate reductase [Planctomycetota bacterium]MDP6409562.1 NCS1 family nucleobase:cation symporter-1 [Planctomycetota bacterium]